MHYRDHVLVHHVAKPEGKVYCQTKLVWKKKSIENKNRHNPFVYFFSIPQSRPLNKKPSLHFRKKRLPFRHQ